MTEVAGEVPFGDGRRLVVYDNGRYGFFDPNNEEARGQPAFQIGRGPMASDIAAQAVLDAYQSQQRARGTNDRGTRPADRAVPAGTIELQPIKIFGRVAPETGWVSDAAAGNEAAAIAVAGGIPPGLYQSVRERELAAEMATHRDAMQQEDNRAPRRPSPPPPEPPPPHPPDPEPPRDAPRQDRRGARDRFRRQRREHIRRRLRQRGSALSRSGGTRTRGAASLGAMLTVLSVGLLVGTVVTADNPRDAARAIGEFGLSTVAGALAYRALGAVGSGALMLLAIPGDNASPDPEEEFRREWFRHVTAVTNQLADRLAALEVFIVMDLADYSDDLQRLQGDMHEEYRERETLRIANLLEGHLVSIGESLSQVSRRDLPRVRKVLRNLGASARLVDRLIR